MGRPALWQRLPAKAQPRQAEKSTRRMRRFVGNAEPFDPAPLLTLAPTVGLGRELLRRPAARERNGWCGTSARTPPRTTAPTRNWPGPTCAACRACTGRLWRGIAAAAKKTLAGASGSCTEPEACRADGLVSCSKPGFHRCRHRSRHAHGRAGTAGCVPRGADGSWGARLTWCITRRRLMSGCSKGPTLEVSG